MIKANPAVIFSAGKIVWLALFVLMGQPPLAKGPSYTVFINPSVQAW
jgi:hypothetical protein